MGESQTKSVSERDVTRANRLVYNQKTPESYDRNESIFNARQRSRVGGILRWLRATTGGERFLDVGCGTGNLLRLARAEFPRCVGVDPAQALLGRVRHRDPDTPPLVAALAQELPFPDSSFDVVGMYALLHHLYDPMSALAEARRVLRPGGMLYTDHDPNHYFRRYYDVWKKLGKRWTFGTDLEDLAEYHQVFTTGLDPEKLALGLRELDFQSVEVVYRHSFNPALKGIRYLAHEAMKHGSKFFPARSLFTHFMIFARR